MGNTHAQWLVMQTLRGMKPCRPQQKGLPCYVSEQDAESQALSVIAHM